MIEKKNNKTGSRSKPAAADLRSQDVISSWKVGEHEKEDHLTVAAVRWLISLARRTPQIGFDIEEIAA